MAPALPTSIHKYHQWRGFTAHLTARYKIRCGVPALINSCWLRWLSLGRPPINSTDSAWRNCSQTDQPTPWLGAVSSFFRQVAWKLSIVRFGYLAFCRMETSSCIWVDGLSIPLWRQCAWSFFAFSIAVSIWFKKISKSKFPFSYSGTCFLRSLITQPHVDLFPWEEYGFVE